MATVIESIYAAGRFGEALNIIEGNSRLYDLMGKSTYYPLYSKVSEKDQEVLSMAVLECSRDESLRVSRCVQILSEGEEPEDYVLYMQKHAGKEEYDIELIKVSEQRGVVEDLHNRMAKARDYLTIIGESLFCYRPSDKSFHLFWVNHEQTVDICRMPLEEWRQDVLKKGWINEADESVFNVFCDTMQKMEMGQTFTFHGKILTSGDREDAYRVRFLIREHGGEPAACGVWSVINEMTNEHLDNFVESSYTDSLTRLLNKKAITEYAERQVSEGGDEYALAVMDIDNFKYVNDTYGHMFGDQVISGVADVIKKSIGANGVAGRIGGDEYMILFINYGGEAGLRNYLRAIKTNVATLFQDKMGSNRLTCSIGVSQYVTDAKDYKELFKIADKALYIAKQKGKNRYIIYDAEKHGQFNMKEDGYDMLEIRDSFYSEKDMFSINRLLGEVVVHGRECLPELLDQTAKTMMLQRITIFWGDALEQIAVNPSAENKNAVPVMAMDNDLIAMFTDDLYIAGNVNSLEHSMPNVCAVFRDTGVHGTIQHLLRDETGAVKGLIAADDCMQIHSFPKLAVQIFENMSEIINGVLIRK